MPSYDVSVGDDHGNRPSPDDLRAAIELAHRLVGDRHVAWQIAEFPTGNRTAVGSVIYEGEGSAALPPIPT